MQKLVNWFNPKRKETMKNPTEEESSFTFKVDDVKPNRNFTKFKTSTPDTILVDRIGSEYFAIDDFSHKNDTSTKILSSKKNGLMAAAHFAYVNQCPLKISVSDFILMIGQGIAAHLEIHAEDVRPYFVNHEGKETITIVRSNFKPEGGNDWSTVFGEFAEGIKKKVKMDFYDLMVDDTSVATKISRIASEIAIIDTFKHYFEYQVTMGCAMTEVTLVGSKDDWEKLRSKVHKLKEFNVDDRLQLDWWLDRLVPLVDQAISRNIDRSFWSKIYQSHDKKEDFYYEPTPLINGWLNVFNPYTLQYSSEGFSKVRKTPGRSNFESIHSDNLLNGVCKAPVTMKHMVTGKTYPMTVYGGFLSAKVNDDGTIGTEYFYAATFNNTDIEGYDIHFE